MYFWNRTLHVSDSNFVLHQESNTLHTAIVIGHTGYADCLLAIAVCTPDGGQRYCPKHVESYSKNEFEELVLIVGFIIRMYHDARCSECQICSSIIDCLANYRSKFSSILIDKGEFPIYIWHSNFWEFLRNEPN